MFSNWPSLPTQTKLSLTFNLKKERESSISAVRAGEGAEVGCQGLKLPKGALHTNLRKYENLNNFFDEFNLNLTHLMLDNLTQIVSGTRMSGDILESSPFDNCFVSFSDLRQLYSVAFGKC